MVKKSNLRLIISIFIAFMVWTSQAQTQQGYVKTLGRPNQKGVALNGVSIRVKGGHNAVLSDAKGFFSMMMAGKKEGDVYALQQVQKQGYQLNDENMIGRRYAFSSKVPLTIVMVSTRQLQADKQRIENNAYKTAEKNYKTQLALLEKQQQANQITIEKYRQELTALQNSFEKYQSLIDGLADHYARTDYDELDAKEQEINLCIENGDLDRAEQLLQALDIEKRLAEIEQRIKAGQQLMDEADEEMALILKQQEKDAEYLYQLYTIALGRFDNEKARYYIETRAQLDSTNVRWQIDAGEFLLSYLSEYQKSLSYYQIALRNCQNDAEKVDCFDSMASLYDLLGDYSKASQDINKAIEIAKKTFGDNSNQLGLSYVGQGVVFTHQSKYQDAKMVFEKGIEILENYNINKKEIATSYGHLGNLYIYMSNDDMAYNCYKKALEIRKEVYSEDAPEIGRSYCHLGLICLRKGDSQKALEYDEKALEIFNKNYGKSHHSIANVYNQIGSLYEYQKNYTKASEFGKKALDMYISILGENHKDVAICYSSVASYLTMQLKYSDALTYYQKALDILTHLPGETDVNINVANILNGISIIANYIQEYELALEYGKKALDMYISILGENHTNVGICYGNIGRYLYEQKKYSDALTYYQKALDILTSILGESHVSIAEPLVGIGDIAFALQKYEKAILFYEKAYLIYKNNFGLDHYVAKRIKKNADNARIKLKEDKGK